MKRAALALLGSFTVAAAAQPAAAADIPVKAPPLRAPVAAPAAVVARY